MPPFYRPPADIDDFARHPAKAATLRQNWHDFISRTIRRRAASGLFYDASLVSLSNCSAVDGSHR